VPAELAPSVHLLLQRDLRAPDGHSKLELAKYHNPVAVGAEAENPPPNTLGLHRVMFAVDDIDDTMGIIVALAEQIS
jgi:hypothetical protein